MAAYDVLIKGGTVIDGLRNGRFTGDIGIKDGRIASIGTIRPSEAAKVLDASGLIVAPGFVDLHTHYDSQIYWDPWCTISGWHGVTSVAIGNCGFGFAPCKPAARDEAMLTLTRNEAVPLKSMQVGLPWDWVTFPEFLNSLERIPKGINVLSYVPLTPLFYYVMGREVAKSRRPNADEMAAMCRLLEQAMAAGACGWSTQQFGESSVQRDFDGTPMVTDVMAAEDLHTFAAALRQVGRGFIQGNGQEPDWWEPVAQVSGRPVLFNSVTILTDQHGRATGNFREQLETIRAANLRGNRMFAQCVTTHVAAEFTLRDYSFFDTNPLWLEALLGTAAERIAKFKDSVRRQALKDDFDQNRSAARGIPNLRVHWVERDELKDYEGRSVKEIAAREGKHPIDAFLDLAVADDLNTGFGTPPRPHDMAAMKEVATNLYAIAGISDGGAHTKFLTLGTYPTDFLSDLVRDGGLMELEEAHWHLSTLPALAAGFRDRGYLLEGTPADILVYDLAQLKALPSERVYDYPAGEWRLIRRAAGYRWILVNGAVTFEDGMCTGATPGKLLRHGRAS